MSNEIMKPTAPFRIGVQRTGLAARKNTQVDPEAPKEPNPNEMEHRIGIVFDDSGSMHNQMNTAHEAVEEFLRSCTKDNTAVTIYPLNQEPIRLSSQLPAIAIMVKNIHATGGTYIKRTTSTMFKNNNLTRAIIFSDGSNGDGDLMEEILTKGICIDTVYIGYDNVHAEKWIENIAKRTDGIFLKFKPGSANFKNAFKYLSPGLRYMLADKSFVEQIQK